MYNTHAHVAAFTNFLLILAGSEKTCETVSDQKPAKPCQRKTLRSRYSIQPGVYQDPINSHVAR